VSVITPEWKLVVTGPNIVNPEADASKRETYLFAIDRDPNETENVAEEHPLIVEWLMRKAREFRALQPANGVRPYDEGRQGFKAPKEWKLPGQ
jgi:arylsulfatase B